MMKADVLSGIDELQVCTAYKYKGETITHLPYTLDDDLIEPVYTKLEGWKEDLTGLTEVNALPEELNRYIAFIEDYVQTPIRLVSVGPDRKQTIFRPEKQ
jgi:adenylosuccinate synthase